MNSKFRSGFGQVSRKLGVVGRAHAESLAKVHARLFIILHMTTTRVSSRFTADVVKEEMEGAPNFDDKVPLESGKVRSRTFPSLMMENLQKLMLSHKGRQMLVFFAPATLYSSGEYAQNMNIEKNTICRREGQQGMCSGEHRRTNLYANRERVEPICDICGRPELRSYHKTISNRVSCR